MSKFIPAKVKDFFKGMRPPPSQVLAAAKAATSTPLKPHVPMIRFRKSGGLDHSSPSSQGSVGATQSNVSPARSPAAAAAAAGNTNNRPNATISLPIIEDWQLPSRYRRRPLDQQEIDYINRGGPE